MSSRVTVFKGSYGGGRLSVSVADRLLAGTMNRQQRRALARQKLKEKPATKHDKGARHE